MLSPEESTVVQATLLAASLPGPLSATLADLEHAPRASRSTTIGLLPYGRRVYLEATGIAVVQDSQYSLTDMGKQVIGICAAAARPADFE